MGKRQGWSWGSVEGPEWMMILGSHWAAPVLAATPEEAVKHEAWDQPWNADRAALAHVTEVFHPDVASGRAYRITPGTIRKAGE